MTKAKTIDIRLQTIKHRAYGIYPKKGYICIDGGIYYKLKDLKTLPLNFRLSFPPELFKAIDKA